MSLLISAAPVPKVPLRTMCDSFCWGCVAPDHSIPTQWYWNPIYNKYKCIDDSKRFIPCFEPVGYGSRGMMENRPIVTEGKRMYAPMMMENFDFQYSTKDLTPSHCKYVPNGQLSCYR
jgi:hypothetical protein